MEVGSGGNTSTPPGQVVRGLAFLVDKFGLRTFRKPKPMLGHVVPPRGTAPPQALAPPPRGSTPRKRPPAARPPGTGSWPARSRQTTPPAPPPSASCARAPALAVKKKTQKKTKTLGVSLCVCLLFPTHGCVNLFEACCPEMRESTHSRSK